MKKRFWALFLAVMMITSVLPTSVFAGTVNYNDKGTLKFTLTNATWKDGIASLTGGTLVNDNKTLQLTTVWYKDSSIEVKPGGTSSNENDIKHKNTQYDGYVLVHETNGSKFENLFNCLIDGIAEQYINIPDGYTLGTDSWDVFKGGFKYNFADASAYNGDTKKQAADQMQWIRDADWRIHHFDTSSYVADVFQKDTEYGLTIMPIKYKVVYNVNGGDYALTDNTEYAWNSTIPVQTPERDGYEFLGWALSGTSDAVGGTIDVSKYWNNKDVVGNYKLGTGMFMLTAQWKKIEDYTVTYQYEGDVPTGLTAPTDSNSPYKANTDVTVLPTPVPVEGYTFDGWYYNDQKYDGGAVLNMPAANVTLSGVWTALPTFSVTYNANGGNGTMTDENSPYYAASTVTVKENSFTKDGYTFAAWNTQADGQGTTYAAGATFSMPATAVTLYAQWDKILAPANWEVQSKAVAEPNNTYKVGDTLTWNIVVKNVGELPGTLTAADIVDQPQKLADDSWVALPGTVTITIPEGQETVRPNGTVTVTASWVIPEGMEGETIKNVAWADDDTDGQETKKESDPIVVAKAELHVSEKTIALVNGQEYADDTVIKIGDTITWNITVTNSGNAAGSLEGITITDKIQALNDDSWVDTEYVVTLNYPEDMTVVADSTATITATWQVPAEVAGLTLRNIAWTSGDAEEPTPSDPITVKGFTVTYNLNGGTSTSEQLVYPELPYGAETPTIDNPSKASDAVNTYTFLSWAPSFEDTVTADVTYVAQWSTIPREAKLSVISKDLKFEDIGNEEGDIMPEMPRAIDLTEYNVGDTLAWIITVQNDGNLDAQLTADMIADTIYYGDTAEGPWTALTGAGVTFPETLPVVMAGETASIEVTWVITEAVAGKYIKNAAKINLEGEKEQEAPPVYVTPTPSVSVSKTADKPSAYVGDKITYTVTVFNDGNVDLKNVTLADSFGSSIANVKVPAGVTYSNGVFTIASLAKNETVTVTYDYTALNAGKLSNTIVATIKVGNEDKVADTDSVVVEIVVYDPVKPNLPDRPMLNREDHYAYIVGYPDGLVHPEKNITRAEVSTIFFRMLLDESREDFWAQENWFSDVPSHMWFNNAVSTLANAGLITGYPDGSFKPNANITRAEFATIAIRFFLEEDVEITENNLSDIKGHWAEANINLAYALNLINGYPDGTFRPNQLITRAEAMTIVNRVLERAPHKDHLLETMIEWPDNMNKDAWYYADVQEATNSHEFHRATENDQKIYEVWTELLPVRDWVALEQMWSQANSSKNPGEIVDFNITTP